MLTGSMHIAANAIVAASHLRFDRAFAQERPRPLLEAEPISVKELLESIEV